ncbi:fimbrial protein [Citrobacter amalonaticus]|uniref:fimbrial protein n=1 Tax=Citrobacter amalonaticus TaxID=35703 RepID=UPI00300C8647
MTSPLSLTGGKNGLKSMIVLSALALSPLALADKGDQYSLNINISGTLVANGSCTFNQGGTLNVDFGPVTLKSVGNNTVQLEGNYQRPLTSDFTCSGDTAGLLQMRFTSTSGSYQTYNGTQVLKTNKGIIAIQLLVNGAAQSMGQWFNVDQANAPSLQAQLVQISTSNSSNVASGDTFSASGTLTMAFN